MTPERKRYQRLQRRWLRLRDDPEADVDRLLELLDNAWEAMTEDEREEADQEAARIAEGLHD